MRHCHHQQAQHKEIFFLPQAVHAAHTVGEEQRDINDAVARTAQPDQHQKSVEEPEAASLLLHQALCLQPPTARNICCKYLNKVEFSQHDVNENSASAGL